MKCFRNLVFTGAVALGLLIPAFMAHAADTEGKYAVRGGKFLQP
jgi:hypothetical protein